MPATTPIDATADVLASFEDDLTVWENLVLVGLLHGLRRADARSTATTALARAGVPGWADVPTFAAPAAARMAAAEWLTLAPLHREDAA